MEKNISKMSLTEKLINYSLLIYVITIYLFSDNAEYVMISKVSFAVFAICALVGIIKRKKIILGYSFWVPYIFLLYCLSSYFWAVDSDAVMDKLKTMFQLFILYFLVCQSSHGRQSIDWLLKSLLVAGLCLSMYSIYYYGWNEIKNALITGTRLGGDISQENIYGMQLAITVILCFYYIIFKNMKKILLLVPLPFVMAMASGSRKALLIIIASSILLIYFKTGMRKMHKFVIGTVILLGALYYIVKLPLFYSVYLRLEYIINFFTGSGKVDAGDLNRRLLIEYAIAWFKQKPIIGYGLGNFSALLILEIGQSTYSHNNYLEMLVGGGIIGFVLYYYIYFYLLYKLYPVVKQKIPEFTMVFILLCTNIISDIGVVSYYSKVTWLFFAFGFLLVHRLPQQYVVLQKSQGISSNRG